MSTASPGYAMIPLGLRCEVCGKPATSAETFPAVGRGWCDDHRQLEFRLVAPGYLQELRSRDAEIESIKAERDRLREACEAIRDMPPRESFYVAICEAKRIAAEAIASAAEGSGGGTGERADGELTRIGDLDKPGLFAVGDRACKADGDYHLVGTIAAVIRKRSGAIRYVLEADVPAGLLHIYSGRQLAPGAGERAEDAGR